MKICFLLLLLAQSAFGQIRVAMSNMMTMPVRTNLAVPYLHGGTNHLIRASYLTSFLDGAGAGVPDAALDVGPTNILCAVNGLISSYSRKAPYGQKLSIPDYNFWPIATNNFRITPSDPDIRYDRLSQRWFFSEVYISNFDDTFPNQLMVAVSDGWGIGPQTVWTFYSSALDASQGFLDYPHLGVDRLGVYVGLNRFVNGNFSGPEIVAFNKAALIAGKTNDFHIIDTSGNGFAPQPISDDNPLSSGFGYYVAANTTVGDTLWMGQISNPGSNATQTAKEFFVTYYYKASSPQANDSTSYGGLDLNDTQLYCATRHRVGPNPSGGLYFETDTNQNQSGDIWFCQNCEFNQTGSAQAGGGHNGVRWYQIGVVDRPFMPFVRQTGQIYSQTTVNNETYEYAAMACTGQGHTVISFNNMSPVHQVQIGFLTIPRSGPAPDGNNLVQIYKTGGGYNPSSFTPPTSGWRWGDYARAVVDPNDDMTVWAMNEISDPFGFGNWYDVVSIFTAPLPPTNNLPMGTGGGAVHVLLGPPIGSMQEIFVTEPGRTNHFSYGWNYPNSASSLVLGWGGTNCCYGGGPYQTAPGHVEDIWVQGAPTTIFDPHPTNLFLSITNPDGQGGRLMFPYSF